MKNTTAKAVLVHPKMLEPILEAASQAGLSKDRIFQFSDSEAPVRHGIPDWRAMMGTPEQGDAWLWPEMSPRDAANTVATINYSSGTTGLPKGVCVSHYNLIANVEQTVFMRYAHKPYKFESRPKERWIGFLPLYHAYGQMYTILMAIKLDVPIYIMSEFRYEDFLFVIGKYRITSLQIAPPILVMLSKRPETARYDISSVKDVLCGAAPLSRELQNECQKRFQMQINQGWGMTEVTCGALHVPGGIQDDTGSVGKLDPNCECKLVDDDGREVAVGQPGEVYIRGPNVCMKYWKNDAATKESFDSDGFLKTGDIAVRNEDGFFWIVDRKKVRSINQLLALGTNITLGAHQSQRTPGSPCRVGVDPFGERGHCRRSSGWNHHVRSPSPSINFFSNLATDTLSRKGEEWPRAYVVIQESSMGKVTPQDVQDWIAKRVAKHKRLVGGVIFIDEVPKLASGKIQRKVMKDWSKRDAIEIEKGAGKERARL